MSTPLTNYPDVIHVMVYIETTGTTPGCKVLQIGACTINLATRSNFRDDISNSSNVYYGLVDNIDTLNWWQEQDPITRNSVFNGQQELKATLFNFAHWCDQLKATAKSGKLQFWCKGTDFDFPILIAAYKATGQLDLVPWKYNETNDMRTIKKNLKVPRDVSNHTPLPAHNAHHDAVNQTEELLAIFNYWGIPWA